MVAFEHPHPHGALAPTAHLELPFFDDAHRALANGLVAWTREQRVDESDDRAGLGQERQAERVPRQGRQGIGGVGLELRGVVDERLRPGDDRGCQQRGVPAHALMNRVFTLTANRTGTEREMTFTGRSMICNTLGEVVATASTEDECVRVVEIDVTAARNKEITSKNNIFADRRPEEYQSLTDSPTARR